MKRLRTMTLHSSNFRCVAPISLPVVLLVIGQVLAAAQGAAAAEYRTFQDRCTQLGGEKAMQNLLKSREDALQCLQSQFRVTQIQEDVRKVMEDGNFDLDFGKYCSKKDALMKCYAIGIDAVRACFTEDESYILDVIMAINVETLEFACQNGGERIKSFLKSGGVACVQGQWEVIILDCINKLAPQALNLTTFQTFSEVSEPFTEENCRKYDVLRSCVTTKLQACTDRKPASIVDSLLRAMKKVTPCGSSGNNMAATLLPVLFSSILVIFSRTMSF